jgi:lysophospholipase L1-like esterase
MRRTGLRRPRVRRHLWEQLHALGLGLLVFLVLLEVCLRLMGAHAYPRPRPVRAGSEFVILCVGDSFTAGTVAGNYPLYLGEILADRGHPVSVINAGLGGANSTMVREALPGFLSSVRPDLVVLLAGGTNLTNYHGYSRFLEPTWWARVDDLLFSVRVWRLGRYTWITLRGPPGGQAPSDAGSPPLLQTSPPDDAGPEREYPDLDRELAACLGWDARSGAPPEPFEEQRRCVEEYIQRRPEDPLGYWALGLLAQRGTSWEEAESSFRACLARDPERAACMEQLGLLLLRRAETRPEALTLLKEGTRLRPQSASAHMALGLYYAHERRFDEGLAELVACATYDPANWACFDKLGTLARTEEQRRVVVARLATLAPESALARDTLVALESMQGGADPLADLAAWAHADLARMVEECRAQGTRVVLQDYPNASRLNAVLRAVALEEGLPFVEQYRVFDDLLRAGAQRADLFEPDGHPTPAGYRRMAEVLADALERGGALP